VNQSALYGTYLCLVKRVRPKVVLAIGASEVLNTVCRELSIPIVEIQHGVFFRSDLENYWPSKIYPDFFLTWDSHFSNLAMEAGVNARVVGHPYTMTDHEAESTSEELGKYICVSLGRNSVDSEDPLGCFPLRLCEAIDGLVEANLPVLIRLHPIIAARGLTSKKLSRWIKKRFGPVRVDNPREISLAETIRSSLVNITWNSATWFEFALFGKSTLMVDKEYAEQFRAFASQMEIWESGNSPVEVLKSNNEFLNSVRSLKNSPSNVSTTKAQDFLRLISEITETYKLKP
jgi:hypothetical protein